MDHFIEALKDDISIVKELPYEYAWSTREFYSTAIRETRVKTAPVHASVHWFSDNVLPVLERCSFSALRIQCFDLPSHFLVHSDAHTVYIA